MCGLVAMIGRLPGAAQEADVFTEMLMVDTLRGGDSTGVFAVTKANNVITYKRALAGWDFVQLHGYKNVIRNYYNLNCLIGHNRSATAGAVTDNNAHPFSSEHITLVHNGTIGLTYNGLPKSYGSQVDSEEIAHNLANHPVEEVIGSINGSFALIWYDAKAKTINFVRNAERPLYLAKADSTATHGWLLASDEHMLRMAATRAKVALLTCNLIPEYTLHSFDLEDLSKVHVRTIEKKFYQADTWFPHRRKGGYRSQGTTETTSTATNILTLPNPSKVAADELLVKLGLAVNEDVEFVLTNAYYHHDGSKFKHKEAPPKYINKMVFLVGWLVEAPYSPVVIHGVTEAAAKQLLSKPEDTVHEAAIVNALPEYKHLTSRAFPKVPFPVIVVRYSTLVEIVYEDDPIEGEIIGPDNKLISAQEYLQLVSHGCAMCTGNLDEADASSITWTHNNAPICSSCTKELAETGGVHAGMGHH